MIESTRCCSQRFANKVVIVTDAGSVVDEVVDGSRPIFQLRSLDVASSILPTVILALLPKCPVCIAAYIAMGTGIGISLPVATHLRVLLIILCATSLTYFVARQIRGRFRAGASA
jgi:hypothetical protein